MKKMTITLDEETAAWARVRAAEQRMSLSRFVGELLREHLRQLREYEAAYRAWRTEKPLKLKGAYPKRDELHDRPVLRRR
jgi:hypothetical protein